MTVDLHSHTRYSDCGRDDPEDLVKTAIEAGVEVFGITDHNYGIRDRKREYFALLTELRDRYRDRITLYRGIEICTHPEYCLKPEEDVSYFDYCLVENLDAPDSIMGGDLLAYARRLGCPTGIAHTDLFGFMRSKGYRPESYLRALAEQDIFWEMNVSFDSIHQFREHQYVKEFLADESQRRAVRQAGLTVSVGFDGHRMEEYNVGRVREMCDYLEREGIVLRKDFAKNEPSGRSKF